MSKSHSSSSPQGKYELWNKIKLRLIHQYANTEPPSFKMMRVILESRVFTYDRDKQSIVLALPTLELEPENKVRLYDRLTDRVLEICEINDDLPTLTGGVSIGTSDELVSITSEDDDSVNWRKQFSTGDELDRTPLDFVVERMIPEQGITGFGGLSGTAKTYIMMSIAKRILTGGMLWGRFKANQYKVLYLIPESASAPFYHRMKRMRIPTSTESFLVRTLSHGPTLPLSGEAMKAAVSGRVVFLDTLIRFMEGKVEQESTDMAKLGDLLLSLLRAGAVAVVFAHHSVKSQDKAFDLTLENAFRGSGDIGAILSAAHAVAQLDADKSKTLIQMQCVKARDFDAMLPFQLQGKPHIDRTGDFKLIKTPGQCASIRGEKQSVRNQQKLAEVTKIIKLLEQGKSQREIESQLGISHNSPAYKDAKNRFKAKNDED